MPLSLTSIKDELKRLCFKYYRFYLLFTISCFKGTTVVKSRVWRTTCLNTQTGLSSAESSAALTASLSEVQATLFSWILQKCTARLLQVIKLPKLFPCQCNGGTFPMIMSYLMTCTHKHSIKQLQKDSKMVILHDNSQIEILTICCGFFSLLAGVSYISWPPEGPFITMGGVSYT